MSRIQFGANPKEILVAMVDRNPGAMSVCMQLFDLGDAFDYGSPLGVLQIFLGLDNLELYGLRLWDLYKGVCGQDVVKLITVVRACDAGLISSDRIHLELREPGGIDFEALTAGVSARWPGFGKKGEA